MHNSTVLSSSAQPHPDNTQAEPRYIATSGVDLVETGLTLDWIIDAISWRCRACREDVALWMIGERGECWIVAVVRPSAAGRVVIQWM